MTVEGASVRTLRRHALAGLLEAVLPLSAVEVYTDFTELMQSVYSAAEAAENCVRKATNVFARIGCSAVYSASVNFAIGQFVVSQGINAIKDRGLRGVASKLWTLIETLKFGAEQADGVARLLTGATTIEIAAGPSAPTPSTNPAPQPSTPAPPVNREAVTSFDRLAAGAPFHGWFIAAWQDFVAKTNTLTTAGVNIGSQGAAPGATTSTPVTMRLCAAPPNPANGACSATLAQRQPNIVNYGATVTDFGDVAVTPGQRYWLIWYQPAAVGGQSWVTYWWEGGAGVSSSQAHSAFVRGYNR